MNAVVVPIVPRIHLKRILYATDFSCSALAALPTVCALARHYGSEVYVQHVSATLPYVMAAPEAICLAEEKSERAIRAEMEKLLRQEPMKGLATKLLISSGDPAEEILRAVRDNEIDLAVAATHGRTGFMRLLMGSLAEELFRILPCPMLTVGPHLDQRFQRPEAVRKIVCAMDLSAESRAVFPVVASLAAEFRAGIVLVHVLPLPERAHDGWLELAGTKRKELERMFASEVDPRCRLEVCVDFGDPAERVLACAAAHRADVIALGVRPAGPLAQHLRTTTPYKLIMGSQCPVLTCRAAS
ncbi:MAG TPA: universal stress protein [Terriglobales bacterium]|nr:universal stress protein [Terriglobales bacterium]